MAKRIKGPLSGSVRTRFEGRRNGAKAPNHNGGRCRHRPPLVPALTAVAGWRGHLSLGGFGSLRGHRVRGAFLQEPERGREAPFGPRWVSGEAVKPLTDPRRVARAGPKSLPSLPGSDPARPKPRRLQGSPRGRNLSGRPFERRLGRSHPAFRGTSRGVSLSKSPFGSPRRPKALPLSRSPLAKAEASSTNPVRVAAGA
jgi:hypothetical protein